MIHGDGLDVAPVPPHQGAITEQTEIDDQGRRRHPARAQGQHLHLLGGEVRRALHDRRDRRRRPRRRGLRRPRAVLAQPRRDGARDLPRRADHPPGQGRLRAVSRLHRQRARDPGRRRPAIGRSSTAPTQPFEAPNWTPRRQRAHLQQERARGRLGRPVPLRSRDAAGDAHRHRRRQPQQQRPRAVVRRHDARHQRSEPGVRAAAPRSTRCRSAAARRSASHAVAVLPPQLVAGRQGPRSSPAAGTTSSTSTGSRPTAAGRRSSSPTSRGWTTGRSTRRTASTSTSIRSRSGTMQIWRMKPDGRNPGADHQRRLQQLVPAHLARRPVDRDHQLPEGRPGADHP